MATSEAPRASESLESPNTEINQLASVGECQETPPREKDPNLVPDLRGFLKRAGYINSPDARRKAGVLRLLRRPPPPIL